MLPLGIGMTACAHLRLRLQLHISHRNYIQISQEVVAVVIVQVLEDGHKDVWQDHCRHRLADYGRDDDFLRLVECVRQN